MCSAVDVDSQEFRQWVGRVFLQDVCPAREVKDISNTSKRMTPVRARIDVSDGHDIDTFSEQIACGNRITHRASDGNAVFDEARYQVSPDEPGGSSDQTKCHLKIF